MFLNSIPGVTEPALKLAPAVRIQSKRQTTERKLTCHSQWILVFLVSSQVTSRSGL
jgi:hypothetical protein